MTRDALALPTSPFIHNSMHSPIGRLNYQAACDIIHHGGAQLGLLGVGATEAMWPRKKFSPTVFLFPSKKSGEKLTESFVRRLPLLASSETNYVTKTFDASPPCSCFSSPRLWDGLRGSESRSVSEQGNQVQERITYGNLRFNLTMFLFS